jgi:hypothetical protein
MADIILSYPSAIIMIVGSSWVLWYIINNKKKFEKGDSIIREPLIQAYFGLIIFIIAGFIILYNLTFNDEW